MSVSVGTDRGAAKVNAAIRRKLLRGSLTVFVGMAAGTVLTLIFNAILARMLPPGTLGAYFLVFSMVMLGTTLAQLGLDRAVVRLVAAARATGDPGRARRAIGVVFVMGTLSALTLGAIVALGLGRFLAVHIYHSPAVSGVVVLAAGWIVVNALLSLTAETYRGFKRFWPATLLSGLAVDILLVMTFGGLWIAGARVSLTQAVALTAAATTVALAAGGVLLWRRVARLRGQGAVGVGEVASISLPLVVTSIASFTVGTGVDLWVVSNFSSASDVALYGAASRLVFFVATPLIIITQVVPPIIAELHARGEREQLERALRSVSTLAGIPAAFVLGAFIVAGGFIMALVYGPYYRHGATVLVILSCARLVAVCTGSSGATLMMTGHQRTLMLLTMATGAFSLTTEILLAPRYGITGVAAATCAAQIMQNALQLTFVRLRVGIWTHARLSLEPIRELVRG